MKTVEWYKCDIHPLKSNSSSQNGVANFVMVSDRLFQEILTAVLPTVAISCITKMGLSKLSILGLKVAWKLARWATFSKWKDFIQRNVENTDFQPKCFVA